MIHRTIHTEPYTKHSTTKCEYPEHSLTDSPPLIDGFELIEDHHSIGEDIQDQQVCEKSIHIISWIFPWGYYSYISRSHIKICVRSRYAGRAHGFCPLEHADHIRKREYQGISHGWGRICLIHFRGWLLHEEILSLLIVYEGAHHGSDLAPFQRRLYDHERSR